MALHPTLDELERAILLYTSPAVNSGPKEWQTMKWLWDHLPWSARFVTHFGVSGSVWWKERYILPILCQESSAYLQQFMQGTWTRVEEESLRHVFHFFVPLAASQPHLFSQEIVQFLSSACPSFSTEREAFLSRLGGNGGAKNASWLRDETFIRYQTRMKALLSRKLPSRPPEREKKAPEVRQEPTDEVRNETRERARRHIEEITATRDEIFQLSSTLDQDLVKAFPIRQEAEESFEELKGSKEEALSLLLSIDGVLMRLSDAVSSCASETHMRHLISDSEKAVKGIRSGILAIRSLALTARASIEEVKDGLLRKLQNFTRVLDHVPMLESSSAFKVHQTRLVKSAREKVKRFRLALTRGPGPQIALCELGPEIDHTVALAKAFYDEGEELSSMQEQLHHFEHRTQQMLAQAQTSKRASSLKDVLMQVKELKDTLEVASDRKVRFEHIEHLIKELEV